jgi:lipoate-protein ligase A
MANKNFNAKSLHHGTILLNVNMENMMKYLNPNKLKLISKGVDSVRSRVLNLQDKFKSLTKDIMYDSIEKEFLAYHNISEYEKIYIEDEKNPDNDKINELYNYYGSWDWKFGSCPEFTDSLSHKFDWGLVDLSLFVERGIIMHANVYSDSLHIEFIDLLNSVFSECRNKYRYDGKGVMELIDSVVTDNESYNKFLNDMKVELIKQIL